MLVQLLWVWKSFRVKLNFEVTSISGAPVNIYTQFLVAKKAKSNLDYIIYVSVNNISID